MTPPGVDTNSLLAYIDGMPLYAQFGWGLGVWSALIGSVLLLMRNRYAVWAFILSLAGMALSFGYMFFGPPGPAGTDVGMLAYFPYFIILIGVLLLLYSTSMLRKGALR